MGIRQRGDKFMVDVTVGGVRKTVTCSTYHEAEIQEADLRSFLLKTVGADVERGNTWTLQQALDKTTTTVWSDKASGVKLARNAEFAVEFFGAATPLSDVTADRLDDYSAHLTQQGNSNATINRKLAAVSRMLALAVERGKLARKPMIQRRKEGGGRVRYLSVAEETAALRWLEQCGKHDHAEVFAVLIDTGLRSSELFRLEGRDCDFTQGVLTIWQTKNGHPRSVPMTDIVKAILEVRKSLYHSGPLFPYTNDWFEHTWDKMKAALQLSEDKQFVPYALRHTCASRLIQRGVGLSVVKEWLGHKTITVTLRYAHLCPSNLLNAVTVLQRRETPERNHDVARSF